jgi:hypothetical protein
MAKLLGTPYETGKSDVVISRRPTSGTILEEGLFVKQGAEGYFGLAQGAAAFGVVGQQEAVACSVVISGMKVAVQLDDAITPSAGGIVYVNDGTDKATTDADSGNNLATAATFTGVIGTDGRSDNTTTKKTTVRWAEINMPNGL